MQLKTLFLISLAVMQAAAAPASIKPSDELAANIASIQKNIAIIKSSDLKGVDPKQILQTLADVTKQVAVIADQTSILATAKEVITNSKIVKEIKSGLDKVEDVAARIGSKITKFIEFSTGGSSLQARYDDQEDIFFDAQEHVELDRRGGAKASQTSTAAAIPTSTTIAAVAPTQPPEESVGALKTISNKLKQTSNAINGAVRTVMSSVTTPSARETAGTIAEISEEIATMSASLTTILGAATLIPAVNGVAAPAVAITAAITAVAKSVDQIATGISKSDADKIASGIKDGAAAGGVKPKN
ncbi:hypothetical protein HDU97_010284 [Phlyctochytrium planicorne]|nr:hypothetical protein HDU97_010284 [Phlyctochytrium planicorne]